MSAVRFLMTYSSMKIPQLSFFQLASQLQKTLDGDAEAGAISDEDDDGGFKRHSVVRGKYSIV